MKKTSKYRDRDRELEIRMTPMIDIVFLLLVFFVWTASFRIQEESLPTSLSQEFGSSAASELPPELDFDQVIIGIADREPPVWSLNETPVGSRDELRERLRRIARAKRDLEVIIDPENQVALGTVIDVFDLAQLAGFEKVRFATPANSANDR